MLTYRELVAFIQDAAVKDPAILDQAVVAQESANGDFNVAVGVIQDDGRMGGRVLDDNQIFLIMD